MRLLNFNRGAQVSSSEDSRFAEIMQLVPQATALGLHVEETGARSAVLRLPYSQDLVAYPDTGVLAGGAIFTLMDTACGGAVMMATRFSQLMATLDLRLDYLKPATPGRDVLARAECYRLTRSAAFVRGVAWTDTPDDPVAHSVGIFVPRRTTQRGESSDPGEETRQHDARTV